ncbi:MAG: DUF2889 domain-containing protein [Gammaproteobacteria bacterium]|nr:DUF2889 domain-containing protein [Gammaproteobacteria bacterium]
MPLSQPMEREHLHTRQVTCEGFRRQDGLWDIEAHLTDTKTYGFANQDRGGRIEAGEPLHEMSIRLTLDLDFLIHNIEAVSDHTPFQVCSEVTEGMKRLIGLRIGPGWMKAVRRRVGGAHGCTHLLEMLRPLSSTAYQTMHGALEERANRNPDRSRPRILDTCYALASDGPIVEREWPEFYTGDKSQD